jgi:hypothetical protein
MGDGSDEETTSGGGDGSRGGGSWETVGVKKTRSGKYFPVGVKNQDYIIDGGEGIIWWRQWR